MTGTTTVEKDGRTLTVRVPLSLRKLGGRKLVVAPEGKSTGTRPRSHPDNAMIKALARAYRWKRMLENGEFATFGDLARVENITPSYLGRVLRLSLLAPDIVEAILSGRQPEDLQLPSLFAPFPVAWQRQRDSLFS